MKTLLIFSLLLLTSCSYFKKQQLHTYDLKYSNHVGSSYGYRLQYIKIVERTKDWLIFLNYVGENDTLYITDHNNLNGRIIDFRPNQTHQIKFVGKIIDESFKSLKIKGEYFVKTPANTDFFYGGVLEIY
ncbi:MAG: hypothetical protein RIT34_1583 [Bacteroidota bacterium]